MSFDFKSLFQDRLKDNRLINSQKPEPGSEGKKYEEADFSIFQQRKPQDSNNRAAEGRAGADGLGTGDRSQGNPMRKVPADGMMFANQLGMQEFNKLQGKQDSFLSRINKLNEKPSGSKAETEKVENRGVIMSGAILNKGNMYDVAKNLEKAKTNNVIHQQFMQNEKAKTALIMEREAERLREENKQRAFMAKRMAEEKYRLDSQKEKEAEDRRKREYHEVSGGA
jgi:hypothetical protein